MWGLTFLWCSIPLSSKWKPTLCDPIDSTVHGILQARMLEWVAFPFSKGIFPTQGSNPGLPHCRQIVYQLSHKGSPRILEWVAYTISSRSSWPRNQTGVSCIAGRFFTNWAIREAPLPRNLLQNLHCLRSVDGGKRWEEVSSCSWLEWGKPRGSSRRSCDLHAPVGQPGLFRYPCPPSQEARELWFAFRKLPLPVNRECFCFCFCHASKACGILIPWLGIKPMPPEVKGQSLNHWTAKEGPNRES